MNAMLQMKPLGSAGLRKMGTPLRAPVLPARSGLKRTGAVRVNAMGRQELLESRVYRRTVADAAYWENYLTQDRYFKNMASIFSSRIILGLAKPLLFVAAICVGVCSYETARELGHITWGSCVVSNQAPWTMTSFAVSLLLVFKTNQSYDRWWEARKVWGTILNRVRDITNQGAAFIPPEEVELKKGVARWTIAFIRSLQAHLQTTDSPTIGPDGKKQPGDKIDLRAKLAGVLNREELDMLCAADHRVVKSLEFLTACIQQSPIEPIRRSQLQLNVQCFYDMMGMCERIIRSPLPITYTRHASRFLFLWMCTLPLNMYAAFGWGMIPIVLLICTFLMGIDEMAVQAEEPFGILPLDAICGRATADAMQIMKDKDIIYEYAKGLRLDKGAVSGNGNMDSIPGLDPQNPAYVYATAKAN